MAAQLTNIIFSSFFFHFTCTFHSWNIKTSHKVPVNPLAPPRPSLGMGCSPGSSGPAVRGLRPVEQLMVRVHLLFPCLHQEGPTLRIFGQNCLYVRKFTVYWLQNKPSVTLHPRAFPSPKSDVFSKATILTDCTQRAWVPVHGTFTALWWPLYWRMKVCTFDLTKTGNLFKFFHSLHASMWALAYMFLWPSQNRRAVVLNLSNAVAF